MPVFDTPEPISVSLELGVADVVLTASARRDTRVEIRPADPEKPADVTAAEQTLVECDGRRLLIKAPRGWRHYTPWGGYEAVDVQIELPAGSDVHGKAAVAALRSEGRLGACNYKTAAGDIQLDDAGPVKLTTAAGDITVTGAIGDAHVTTSSGALRLAQIDGTAVVRNLNGDTWIGRAASDIRVNATNGSIVVDEAHGGIAAKTANGDIRFGSVQRGAIVAATAFGKVEIGVVEGVATWLDLSTRFGHVDSDLDATELPEPDEATVEVRVRTSFGDVLVHHAHFAGDLSSDE